MDSSSERRLHRRIPLGCKIGIKAPGGGEPVVGICTALSVGGMTIQSGHVPRMGEVFEVAVLPPELGGSFMPLHARVQVRRCDGLEEAGRFEMGVEIVEIIK